MQQVKINSVIGSQVVSLEETKDFLRVDDSTDDDIITRMIDSATKWCENYLSRDIISKNRTFYQDYVDSTLELLYDPVATIVSVKSDGLDIDYKVKGLDNSVIDLQASYSDVMVTYETQGLTDSIVKDAILTLVETYYDNRSDFVIGKSVVIVPTGVKSKLDSVKKMWF